MPARLQWSRDELLVAFRLYCATPFGRLHWGNPEIIRLSRVLGRTPSAVAMKACNFASLDPAQKSRHIRGLGNVARADQELWAEFGKNPGKVAFEAETAYAALQDTQPLETAPQLPEGPSEAVRIVRARRLQSFFREAVMVSYGSRCALSDIATPDLLNASLIVPWNVSVERRADPRNGIALNALYDRAFDRGLITLDESLRVVLSRQLRRADSTGLHRAALLSLEGCSLRSPSRWAPDPEALAYHREHVFSDR